MKWSPERIGELAKSTKFPPEVLSDVEDIVRVAVRLGVSPSTPLFSGLMKPGPKDPKKGVSLQFYDGMLDAALREGGKDEDKTWAAFARMLFTVPLGIRALDAGLKSVILGRRHGGERSPAKEATKARRDSDIRREYAHYRLTVTAHRLPSSLDTSTSARNKSAVSSTRAEELLRRDSRLSQDRSQSSLGDVS